MKRILLYATLIALAAWFLFQLIKSSILLYFGVASLTTTITFYLLALLIGAAFFLLLKKKFRYAVPANLMVLLVTVWASLLIGEVTLRYTMKKYLTYNERLGYNYRSFYSYLDNWESIKMYFTKKQSYWYLQIPPNYSRKYIVDGHTFFHNYNSLSLRDDEKQPAPDDSLNLVIGMGDSFAEGIGTAQDSTWIKFFEREVNACSTNKIRTLNAGVAGSDVYFAYVLLEKLLRQFHPNTVVLAINSSDIDDVIIRGGMERFKPDGKLQFSQPPYWEKLYATSFIFRTILHSQVDLDWTLLTMKEKPARRAEAIDSIGNCIKRFHELAKQKGFKLVVVFHPREDEIKTGDFPYNALAAKLAADTSYTIINMKDEFANSGRITKANSGEFYWPVDLHHNTKGYRVLGELIAERMRGNYAGCK